MRLRWGTGIGAAGLVLALALAGCGGDDDGGAGNGGAGDDGAVEEPGEAGEAGGGAEPEVRDELLAMMADDQDERLNGGGSVATDRERAERLREIVDEHGWPTLSMVGKEGATAAWVIAQHSDFDVELQEEFLGLMHDAGDDVDASEVAYLEDRVAVNKGEPQRFGTQARCVAGGGVEPATPLVDEAGVDDLRAEAGMAPLADYFAEFGAGCAEATSGIEPAAPRANPIGRPPLYPSP